MKPNPQQQLVVDHFEGPCLVMAVPGSGKTASVTERTKRLVERGVDPRSILAITFTNKAALEMRTRIAAAVGPRAALMVISTFHSLCSKLLRANAEFVGLTKDYTIYDSDQQERLLKTSIRKIEEATGPKFKISDSYRNQVLGFIEGKRNGCLTEIAAAEKYDLSGNQLKVCNEYFDQLKKSNAVDFTGLLTETIRLFDEQPAVRDKYRARFRYISVDEVQDTNIAQYELIKHLGLGHKNVLMVGDLDQCVPADESIRMADGTDREISKIQIGDEVQSASGRKKSKGCIVRKIFKKRYSGDVLCIRTIKGHTIRCTPNHVLFGKMNPLPNKWFVYLMYKADKGFRIGRTTGCRSENKSTGNQVGLKVRANQEHADRSWVLKVCDSLQEAAYYEVLLSLRYQIPTVCFHTVGRGLALDQDCINRLFGEIDSYVGAKKLMADLDIFFDYPHLARCGREAIGRSVVTINMFGHKFSKNGCYGHLVTLHGGSVELKNRLEEAGFKTSPSKREMWRYRRVFSDYAEAVKVAEDMARLDKSLMIIRKACLAEASGNEAVFIETPAAHLHPGMSIAIIDGDAVRDEIVSSIEREAYDGFVFDLSVENTCNFISTGGIIAHNSIYKFRNANPENILQFEKDFSGCKVLMLEKNYRSTPSILKHSQNLIDNNVLRKGTKLVTDNADGEPPRVWAGETDYDMADIIANNIKERIAQKIAPKEIAILYRTNYASRVLESALRRHMIKYKIIGGLSFWDRKECKTALSLLKLMCNDNDRMAFEVSCDECCKGVGDKSLAVIAENASTSSTTILDAARVFSKNGTAIGKKLEPFITAFDGSKGLPPGDALLKVATETSLWNDLRKDSTTTNDRCANIAELAQDVNAYCSGAKNSLSGYLQTLALATEDENDNDNVVKLMTLHGCKGLEFDVVYVSHCLADLLPHARLAEECEPGPEYDQAVEEERRLLYVGMTRARKHLTLLFSVWKLDARSKAPRMTYPSQFLFETGIKSLDLEKYRFGADPTRPPKNEPV